MFLKLDKTQRKVRVFGVCHSIVLSAVALLCFGLIPGYPFFPGLQSFLNTDSVVFKPIPGKTYYVMAVDFNGVSFQTNPLLSSISVIHTNPAVQPKNISLAPISFSQSQVGPGGRTNYLAKAVASIVSETDDPVAISKQPGFPPSCELGITSGIGLGILTLGLTLVLPLPISWLLYRRAIAKWPRLAQ